MNHLQSFQNYAESCGCDHSEDKKKKSKVTKEEIIKEYGDPTVSKRLKVARLIDKVNPKPKYNSKRAKISNALKMSSIKAETRKRKAKENPYSAGKKLRAVLGINKEGYIPEEGYDQIKDRIAMAGGDPSSPKKKDATTANHTRNNETDAQRKVRMLKQQKNSARAVEMVKQRIRDKYGKNAIMDVGKKNEEVQLEKVNLKDKSTQYARSTKEVDTAMTDHVNRTKGRHYGRDGKVTEVGRYRKQSKREARNELINLYKESRMTSTNDMQSKLYAKNNSMGRARTDDEIKKEKGGQAFLDRIKAAKSKMKSEGTSYGIYKGTGKPSGPMAAFAKKTKKKKEVKEEMGNIAHTKTKKGGKTIINVNKNDEADAQKAMKNDPKYILGKTRVQSYKEEFYQKRYTTGGYKPVGKNKRMDQSNKRSGDSKAQHRDLHKDLAKYGHTKTGKASNLKSSLKSFKESAWQRKEGKNPSGGLNEKGRKSYERENPGSDLKAPVTGKPKKGSKAEGRQNSFCARMSGVKGPMMKDGKPTRKKLALDKWDC